MRFLYWRTFFWQLFRLYRMYWKYRRAGIGFRPTHIWWTAGYYARDAVFHAKEGNNEG